MKFNFLQNLKFLFFSFTFCTLALARAELPSIEVFELKSDKKRTLNLDQQGKASVILFWASWCSSCKEMMRLIEKLPEEQQRKFKFISIALDEKKDDSIKGSQMHPRFIKKQYWIAQSELNKKFQIETIPYILLFEKNGFLDTVYIGSNSDKQEYFLKRMKRIHETIEEQKKSN